MTGADYVRSIQVFRAVAATMVVLFHASNGAFAVGAAGVDVFFVISGFIMGSIGIHETARSFALRRLVRIVPLYWTVTLSICLASLLPDMFSSFSFDAVRLLKSLFFIPYFNEHHQPWPLLVAGWTLNDEMIFYVVFALGLAAGHPVVLTASVLTLAWLAGLVVPHRSAILGAWTDQIVLEFAFGLLLSRAKWPSTVLLGPALLIAGIAGLSFSTSATNIPDARLLTWGVPALLLVAGGVVMERHGHWPRMRALERIGDASYSIYLLHGIVIAAVHKYGPDGRLSPAVMIGGSLASGYACHRLFERPVARMLLRYRYLR